MQVNEAEYVEPRRLNFILVRLFFFLYQVSIYIFCSVQGVQNIFVLSLNQQKLSMKFPAIKLIKLTHIDDTHLATAAFKWILFGRGCGRRY